MYFKGIMLIDSHCHLDYPDFAEEGVDKVVMRALGAGVLHMVTICTRIAEFDKVKAVAEKFDEVDCTVGTHPHHADEEFEKTITVEKLVELSRHKKIVGLGETGLDYYYKHAPADSQHERFRVHIQASLETGLPLIIHTRDADDDTIRILREEAKGKQIRAVLHCFSSTRKLAEEALAMGLYISFSGITTFKNAQDLRDIAKDVPMDKILVETDSPYLAPVPMRGKRNEPSFVVHTARLVAELKGVSDAKIAAATTENFYRLFDRARKVVVQ